MFTFLPFLILVVLTTTPGGVLLFLVTALVRRHPSILAWVVVAPLAFGCGVLVLAAMVFALLAVSAL